MTETTDSTDSTESQPQADGISANGASDPQIQELEAAVKEKENKYLYLYAEFDNFKKRALKERSDLMKFGWENVARDLLLVLDNIDRALQHAPTSTEKNFMNGLQMVQQQFRDALIKQGVQKIDVEKKAFDPHIHEAVGQLPSELPAGTIVKEETAGYLLHGRLLRPSRVIVSMGTP